MSGAHQKMNSQSGEKRTTFNLLLCGSQCVSTTPLLITSRRQKEEEEDDEKMLHCVCVENSRIPPATRRRRLHHLQARRSLNSKGMRVIKFYGLLIFHHICDLAGC